MGKRRKEWGAVKQTKEGIELDKLKSAVWSIYGSKPEIARNILERELHSRDFVLEILDR